MNHNGSNIESRLWAAADELRANSKLKSSEYSVPVLGLVFLRYADVAGLCKVATLSEIEAQGWSLNPGRYVGVTARAEEDFDFRERLEELNEELEALNAEARELEDQIAENVVKLLEGE